MAKKKEVPKEACTMAEVCISHGTDCSDQGRIGRENECFDDGTDKAESLPESIAADGSMEPGAGESIVPEDETIGDMFESGPFVPETVSAGGNKIFTCTLEVNLTDEELAEHGAEMARLIGVWAEAKLNKQASNKAFKNLIDETEVKYLDLAKIVRSSSEIRSVPCYWEYDKEHGIKTLYRCDTGAFVKEANMELLDYSHDEPDGSESIKNVEEAFQITDQQEAVDPSAGNQDEPQGEVATEEESPFTEDIPAPPEPALCVCDNLECSHEDTVIPGTECEKCIFGAMLPADVGEDPEQIIYFIRGRGMIGRDLP